MLKSVLDSRNKTRHGAEAVEICHFPMIVEREVFRPCRTEPVVLNSWEGVTTCDP